MIQSQTEFDLLRTLYSDYENALGVSITHVIVARMDKDSKYFVVADSDGYLSVITGDKRSANKRRPVRSYVGHPTILSLHRLTNGLMVVTPYGVSFANLADSKMEPYSCEFNHMSRHEGSAKIVNVALE